MTVDLHTSTRPLFCHVIFAIITRMHSVYQASLSSVHGNEANVYIDISYVYIKFGIPIEGFLEDEFHC